MDTLINWVLGALIIAMISAMLYYVYRLYYAEEQPQRKLELHPAEAEYAEEIAAFPEWQKNEPLPDAELPDEYRRDYIMLMVKDPHWLYAYWEITAGKIEKFKNEYGEDAWHKSRPVLRVYNITDIDYFDGTNCQSYYDIYLSNDARDWHIEIGQPNKRYCLDIGRMLPEGRFITILRSNTVTTPRNYFSNLSDEDWPVLEGLYEMPISMNYTEFNGKEY